jgi:hypothetical protein
MGGIVTVGIYNILVLILASPLFFVFLFFSIGDKKGIVFFLPIKWCDVNMS